jgi:tetratricopeptide (TPR) repeat protein
MAEEKNFDKIINEITSNLTGNREKDLHYLLEQFKKYEKHKYAKEIIRVLGRKIYKLLPDDMKKESHIPENAQIGTADIIETAAFQMHKKNPKKAFEIIKALVKTLEEDDFYKNDAYTEYHFFNNALEEILYREICKPTKKLEQIPENYAEVYYNYGAVLFELKKYGEARQALEKAKAYNPVYTTILFELSETYKVKKEWDGYLKINGDCLRYAYSKNALARCYRNYGFYFTERKNYEWQICSFF